MSKNKMETVHITCNSVVKTHGIGDWGSGVEGGGERGGGGGERGRGLTLVDHRSASVTSG